MENVIAERMLAEAVTGEALNTLARQLEECLNQNRVRPQWTYLGLDGRRMVCVYQAPDAEAVRRVNRQAGMPATSVWTSSLHQAPGAAAPAGDVVVVERSFPQPVEFQAIQALEEGGAWCLDLHRVRFLRTYFSLDRRRMLCLYQAPDAEAVRTAQKKIGMPFESVWPARFEPH